jgi:hypothetical protein
MFSIRKIGIGTLIVALAAAAFSFVPGTRVAAQSGGPTNSRVVKDYDGMCQMTIPDGCGQQNPA